jgi:PAS domain S-box-containing protein
MIGKTDSQHKSIGLSTDSAHDLRRQAEEKAATMRPYELEVLSSAEAGRLVHELRVHQLELEMQNEELLRAQAELGASRARYFDLYDLAPVGYCTVSEKGLILEANLTAATLFGVARGALVKQLLSRFILKEDQYIYYRHRKQLLETLSTSSWQAGEPQACELRMVRKDGSAFWVHLEATGPQDPSTISGQGTAGVPPVGDFHGASPVGDFHGASPVGDFQGSSVCRVVMSDITGRKRAEEALQEAIDELEQHVESRTEALRQANEELQADITERKRADEALQESEEKYRSLAASVDSMYLVDRDCTYLFMNEGHRMRFGLPLEELIGRRYGDFHSEEDAKEFAECIREVCETGKPSIKEHRSAKNGGYFLRTLTPLMGRSPAEEISKVVIVSKDITELKRAEKDLIQTVQMLQETRDMLIRFEKEAAVGRLAAGVAHEILNPLSIVSSRLQFLEEETLAESARENVRVSREQLQRIVKTVRDLHLSSAKQPGMLVGGDLRRVIDVGLQMTEGRIREDRVQVEYDPPPEVIPVKMAMTWLVKVVVHLILNACDALLNTDRKRLNITVQYPITPDKPPSVLLIVADNGCGISEKTMNKVFDYFFTTKDPGKGTGLGLSVCKSIIQEHGGTIQVKKNDMGGASFIVSLPLSDW